jgi:hypothetical protein
MTQEDLARVDRLYGRLAEALERTRRMPFDAPVTVAEIYQELVPYRVVRSEVGFDMNADYEHALLQLLSGEDQRVRMDPPHAVEEIRRELRGTNPNLSIYREYAACDVWVSRPAGVAAAAEHGPVSNESANGRSDAAKATAPAAPPKRSAPYEIFSLAEDDAPPADVAASATSGSEAIMESNEAEREETLPETRPSAAHEDVRPSVQRDEPRAATVPIGDTDVRPEPAQPAAETTVESASRTADVGRCAFCDSTLPQSRAARFCPFCGADQSMHPCAECGEVVEPGWVYCIACGASAR